MSRFKAKTSKIGMREVISYNGKFVCICGASFKTFNEFKKHVMTVHHSGDVDKWLL